MYVSDACACLAPMNVIYNIPTVNNNSYTIYYLQFSKPSAETSESESDIEQEICLSDESSQPEDPTVSSRKTLFKGKGKGVGKTSEKSSKKGGKHLQIAQKVRK